MDLVFPAPAPVVVPVSGGGGFPVRRVWCVGRNYAEHAQEMGATGREPPCFFMKPADAVVAIPDGAAGRIAYPTLTANLHHEVELVLALGRGGSRIAAAEAAAHVFGLAIGIDLTRRDLQNEMKKQGRPWEIGKAFEQSAPMGPIHRAADPASWARGSICLSVNGQTRQSSDLAEMIWNVAEIIHHLSEAWTLAPGDLVFTGTPAGVGPLLRGDRVHAAIDGLGSLDFEMV